MNCSEENHGKNLMLKVVEHNWGLVKAGDVLKVLWEIYYDRTYTRTQFASTWKPGMEGSLEGLPDIRGDIKRGIMETASYENLRLLAEKKPWRSLKHNIDACDGAAYNIMLYSENGDLLNSSGETGYIYGEETLEKIVGALPNAQNSFKIDTDNNESYLLTYLEYMQLFKE